MPLALFGWIPVCFLLFVILPARRAVLTGFLLGWLFLPQATLRMPGALPDYRNITAICLGVLLNGCIFDLARFLRFRPCRWDLPVLLFCVSPIPACLWNGQGLYTGLSGTMYTTIQWGLPYFIGRLYFSDRRGLLELALAVVIGGLIYVPLCAFELKMSPQLHTLLYGYHQHTFSQSYRFGGWRPTVFMEHGLAVGMWMGTATLLGTWLWLTAAVRRWEGLSLLLLLALGATALLCKSFGALVLLIGGLGVLAGSRFLHSPWPLVLLIAAPVAYVAVRAPGLWSGRQLVRIVTPLSPDRARSLETRLYNEDILSEKARRQPLFGWGLFGNYRVRNEWGKDISITDGQWVINFGERGLLGLGSWLLMMTLPGVLFLRRAGPERWAGFDLGHVLALVVMIALSAVDQLFNAQFNPFVVLAMGGITSLCGAPALSADSSPSPDPELAGHAAASVGARSAP